MKLFLDDERQPPEGWVLVRWPEDAIELLRHGDVTHISLDHDLGDDERGTGYDVLTWIERAVVLDGFSPPEMSIHTSNASARLRMQLAVTSIKRLHEQQR
jgi:hypothetical protein